MPPIRVAVLDDYLGVALECAPWDSVSGISVSVFNEPIVGQDQLAEVLAPFDIVCAMRERTALPASLLKRLPALRLIVTTGMQNQVIDIQAAHALGIVVSGTSSSMHPTVELTWALILGAARYLTIHDRGMRAGAWQSRMGLSLSGRRLGVIGLGRNGSEVAKLGLAFNMDVVAWSHNLTRERAAAAGVSLVSKDVLLATSDVITIHLRLSERTLGLIDDDALHRMRPSAILVNTSRGPIVDEEALIRALDGRLITMAALDVYAEEPLPREHPFRLRDDVLLSPHVGYVTDENMKAFYEQTVENIAAFLSGTPLRVLTA